MEMEPIIPSPPVDLNFHSASTTPYISSPSSPRRFCSFYYSAPTSPARDSAFYHGRASSAGSLSEVPFNWEEKPGVPKTPINSATTSSNYGDAGEELLDDKDFAFDFSGCLENIFLPADELFHGGKIKPLKPPPRFQYDKSPKSPRSPKQIIREALSPRQKTRDLDPFAAAMELTRQDTVRRNADERRGRERRNNQSTRLFEPDPIQEPTKTPSSASLFSSSSSYFSSFWYKKWKIKDLLLFRSASEGRGKDKEELKKKYTLLKKARQEDDVMNSSFRSTESIGSGCRRKSGPSISAHEMHYTINRQFSEEMKKKTSLPYKQGLLGCLGFHPTAPDHFSTTGITTPFSRG